jgi:hypothetical protein
MSTELDFERAWQQKLYRSLKSVAGAGICSQVLEGGDSLSVDSASSEIVEWSRGAMERLTKLVGKDESREIMTSCACQYPPSELAEIRQAYQDSGDVDLALRMLQAKFESFLKDSLSLQEGLVSEIVSRGWGLAGVRQGDIIFATKIPKSGHLREYFQEDDSESRRQLYCHCPRVSETLKTSGTMPEIYCYCGAGFYKGIWEEILQRPVKVEVLETVLAGGDVCRIAVHLLDGV